MVTLLPIALYGMQHTCQPGSTTHMYDAAAHLLPWQCNPHAKKGAGNPHARNGTPLCIVPSTFDYLINNSKTIGDIQFLLWQSWSFLTDKVLTFPSRYFHVKTDLSEGMRSGVPFHSPPHSTKDPTANPHREPHLGNVKPTRLDEADLFMDSDFMFQFIYLNYSQHLRVSYAVVELL